MLNFTLQNPVKIVFGKGAVAQLPKLIDKDAKICLVYGGGSIKKNGVYDQVITALKAYKIIEFSGIEVNPQYATCMKIVEKIHSEKIDFILAVGGGSVLDAVKFIAAAVPFEGKDPWSIVSRNAPLKNVVPFGAILTLPATGSEMNANAVISRQETGEKLAFSNPLVYPRFSILDPEVTYSLPERQVANGIVDAFAHVCEQYMTTDENTPIQDRFAESILTTLIETAPKVKKDPNDYNVRANIFWATTMALNGIIGSGVKHDWATHQIGHEVTALHGIDHARTLSIIMPAVWKHQKQQKLTKLAQYGRRVWKITGGSPEMIAEQAIAKTEAFFKEAGVPVRLSEVDLTPEMCQQAVAQLRKRRVRMGEHGAIGADETAEILELAR
jgi:NADP-dependent alcohol dehydrogenase